MLGQTSDKRMLGLDWDVRSVRLMDARLKRNEIQIVRALSATIPAEADGPIKLGEFLRELLDREKIRTRAVVIDIPRDQAVLLAMEEVMPPILMATLAIILSFIPMFFISGMMGPYMAPMALNVPLTMISSLLVALAITPWVSSKLLKGKKADAKPYDIKTTKIYSLYSRVMGPFVNSRKKSRGMLFVVAGLFAFSILLAATGLVPLKMLPFDNKKIGRASCRERV